MLDLACVRTNTCLKNVRAKNASQRLLDLSKRNNLGFLEFKSRRTTLFVQGKVIDLEFVQKGQAREIDSLCSRRPLALVRIIGMDGNSPQTLILDIIIFSKPIKQCPETITINFNKDKILEDLKRRYPEKDAKKCLERFKEDCILLVNNESYFLISGHAGETNTEEEMSSFRLRSTRFALGVKTLLKDDLKILEAHRLQATGNFSSDDLILVRGTLEFKYHSTQTIHTGLLEGYQGNTYLEIYKKHLFLECKRMLERVRRFGVQEIKKIEHTKEGYKLYFAPPKTEALAEGDILRLEKPTLERLKGLEELKGLDLEDCDAVLKFMKPEKQKFTERSTLQIKQVEKEWVEVASRMDLEDRELWVWLDYRGEGVHLGRKLVAWQKASQGTSANPNLFLILDVGDKKDERKKDILEGILKSMVSRKIPALTLKTQNKVFKNNPPTSNQKKAIGIALNTPDIAVIQGPPGTGKTTVINAICERLYEESDQAQNLRGSVLVCAHGHDATTNVCSRLEIGGLPTPKFGNKEGEDDTKIDATLQYSQKLAANAKKNIPDFTQKERILELEKALDSYRKSPVNFLSLLEFIEEHLLPFLDQQMCSELEILRENLTPKPQDLSQLSSIYALRTKPESFEDDGMERNYDLLFHSPFKSALDKTDKDILQEINPDTKQLKQLKLLQERLLARFTPTPHFSRVKRNKDLENFVEEILERLKSQTPLDRASQVLLDYVQKLENNPDEDFFRDYSFAFASTTGQSDRAIRYKKQETEKVNEKEEEFDTVIIDEAAKISPLDLLIVMVLAKKRIILVGDHRQLPHEKDEEISQKILEDKNFSVRDIETMISESLFALLKKRAEFLEKIDGKKRQITLQDQFRSHPILGKFVSDVFYKKHGESFGSPLDAIHFKHHLTLLEGKPCAWIDVGTSRGVEEEKGTSFYREAEVSSIFELWRQCREENEHLSFGIITFYRAQREKLEERFQRNFKGEMPRIGTVMLSRVENLTSCFCPQCVLQGGVPLGF